MRQCRSSRCQVPKAMLFTALFIAHAFISVAGGLYEGDFCETSSGRPGVCRRIEKCRSARRELERGGKPRLCGFSVNEPVVCCRLAACSSSSPPQGDALEPKPRSPAKRAPGERAREKCDEYAGYRSLAVAGEEEPEERCGRVGIFVVGGRDADPREFPHMAQIGYETRGRIVWKCGGSLISPRFVLTAAHCAQLEGVAAKWARLGDYNRNSEEDERSGAAGAVNSEIAEVVAHPGYRPPLSHDDVALCRLAADVTVTPFVRPVCLHAGEPLDTTQVWATGWGHTQFGGVGSDVLQKVDLYVKEEAECRAEYPADPQTLPRGVLDSMLCAGAEQRDTCQGDSGGPLHVKNNSFFCLYTQVGVTSFGKNCGTQSGVYSRVASFIGWIEDVVWPE